MATTQAQVQELINEIHKTNINLEKLIERDKFQNKRIDKLEEEIESLRTKIDSNKDFVNKVLGAISFIAFSMPLILRYIK